MCRRSGVGGGDAWRPGATAPASQSGVGPPHSKFPWPGAAGAVGPGRGAGAKGRPAPPAPRGGHSVDQPAHPGPRGGSLEDQAWDRLSKYDLSSFNPWHLDRLREFARRADEPETTTFQSPAGDKPWLLWLTPENLTPEPVSP